MDEKNYIPASALITIDNIPDILGFVQEGLSGILSKILISELSSDISIHGDSTFYDFNLVFTERIAVDLTAINGLALVLNPTDDGTEIPMTIGYNIPVLK
jgi:hypothetical protein